MVPDNLAAAPAADRPGSGPGRTRVRAHVGARAGGAPVTR